MKNYLSKAKDNLEKDQKVFIVCLLLQIKLQEEIIHKIDNEVKVQYDEIKDEQQKIIDERLLQLQKNQMEIEKKITKIDNELKFNLQHEYLTKLSNFILTK